MATISFVTIIRDQCNKLRRVYRNDVMMSRWHHCPGDLLPLHRTESANAPDRILSRQSFANWSTVVFYFTPSKRGSQYLIDARFRTNCAQYRLICNCIRSYSVIMLVAQMSLCYVVHANFSACKIETFELCSCCIHWETISRHGCFAFVLIISVFLTF